MPVRLLTFVAGVAFAWGVASPVLGAQSQDHSPVQTTSSHPDSSGEVGPWSRLTVHGDSRFRVENNSHLEEGSRRNRLVFRVRLGAEYTINPHVSGGLRLATGSPDDPNSTDVTLGNFNDDVGGSLDRAFLRYATETVSLTGGKFENPFLSTDLVWDGDVNPQGVAGTATLPSIGGMTPNVSGLFFLIDERSDVANSWMGGGQLLLRSAWSGPVRGTAALGYYDYEIRGLGAAGPGDTRSNRLTPSETAYRSDFDLVDVLAQVAYDGWGPRWPLQGILNYVHNAGAFDDENDGLRVAMQAGRESEPGDIQLRYAYTRAETDAVLAAFSNDNTTLPTNYRQHTVAVDYVVLPATVLNLTWYLYRLLRTDANGIDEGPRSRLRLNLSVFF